jgi:hypothetical protein
VECDENKNIVGINIPNEQLLVGFISPEIGKLTMLQKLNLGGGKIKGTIPNELGSCTLLQELNLSKNNIEGTIPPGFSNLAALKKIYLDGNPKLSGVIDLPLLETVQTDSSVIVNGGKKSSTVDIVTRTSVQSSVPITTVGAKDAEVATAAPPPAETEPAGKKVGSKKEKKKGKVIYVNSRIYWLHLPRKRIS